MRFQPSDDLTVDLGLDYTESTSNGGASKLIDYFGYNGGYNNPAVAGVQGDSTPPIFTGGISNQAAYQTLFPVGTPENYAPVFSYVAGQVSSVMTRIHSIGGRPAGPGAFLTNSSRAVVEFSFEISNISFTPRDFLNTLKVINLILEDDC